MMKSIVLVSVMLSILALPAHAQNTDMLKELEAPVPGSDEETEKLCGDLRDLVSERRHAAQKAELEELQSELQRRIEQLEQKRMALEEWAKRRDEFARQADGTLVDVYATMAADAAAERLSMVETGLSAALLLKLKPRTAAAILGEMDASKASSITRIMAASADPTTDDS